MLSLFLGFALANCPAELEYHVNTTFESAVGPQSWVYFKTLVPRSRETRLRIDTAKTLSVYVNAKNECPSTNDDIFFLLARSDEIKIALDGDEDRNITVGIYSYSENNVTVVPIIDTGMGKIAFVKPNKTKLVFAMIVFTLAVICVLQKSVLPEIA